MSHTVIGLFDSRSEAQAAMQELIQKGFVKEHIDVSNKSSSAATTTESSSATTNQGGVSGFFNSLFGDDENTAANYTNVASDADAILTVHVDSDDRARIAAEILDRHGAIDVDERGSSGSQTTPRSTANVEGSTAIPIIEEELQVGKREVESGRARIRSRIIEKPVEASVRLREEHVVVNRSAVNRAVTDADMANFKDGDIEITERSEQAVVAKQARVVEEVTVGKTVTEREETISDTVRRTDVKVEEIDADVQKRQSNN